MAGPQFEMNYFVLLAEEQRAPAEGAIMDTPQRAF